MKPILIFGAGKIADVIGHFMIETSNLDVQAFVVDDGFKEIDQLNGKPILTYSECLKKYTPNEIDFFVAIGYHDLNKIRAKKLAQLKSDGFGITSYIHPNSGIPSDLVFCENTFIMDHVSIHPKVKLGSNNFVWSGAMIGHHSIIGDHNWFTSGCKIGGNVSIGEFNFFALNSVLSHSIQVGNENFFGANTLVSKNVTNQTVFITESTKPFRLTSNQFLRFSNFGGL